MFQKVNMADACTAILQRDPRAVSSSELAVNIALRVCCRPDGDCVARAAKKRAFSPWRR